MLDRFLFGVMLLFSMLFIDVLYAQNQQAAHLDSLIEANIFQSEQALFGAKFEEAERYIDIAQFKEIRYFEDRQELNLKLRYLRIQGFKHIVYQQDSNEDSTLNTLRDLRIITRKVTDKNILGDYFSQLSSVYHSIGIADSASYYSDKALELYKGTENFKKVAQLRGSQISRRHNRLRAAGEIEKVLLLIPEYIKEIEFARKYDNKYVLSYNTRHLGQIYRRQTSNHSEAMRLFQASLKLREEIGFKIFLPASYSSVGDVAYKIGEDKKAIEMYLHSIDLAEEIGFVRYKFHPRIKLGDIYKNKGNIEEAKKFYIEALKASSSDNYEVGIIEARKKLENLTN